MLKTKFWNKSVIFIFNNEITWNCQQLWLSKFFTKFGDKKWPSSEVFYTIILVTSAFNVLSVTCKPFECYVQELLEHIKKHEEEYKHYYYVHPNRICKYAAKYITFLFFLANLAITNWIRISYWVQGKAIY